MKNGIHSELTVGEFERENRAKLEELEQRRELLTIFSYALGAGGIAGAVMFSPAILGLAALPPLGSLLGALQTTSQRFLLMTDLLAAFEDENVAIEVGLKPEGLREIDFFLRFPDKEYVLMQIRSLGEARVTYNEEREALQFRKKGGGLTVWKPDPLSELARQEQWLRKEQPELLGTSSRDRRRPLSKLLVLASATTLGDHPEHLYDTIDDQKRLVLRKFGTANIVTQDQVVDFIRGYLASRRSPKTS